MTHHISISRILTVLMLSLLSSLTACKKNENASQEDQKGSKTTQISVVTVGTQNLALSEETVGTLEGVIDPTVAAEIGARITKILVHPGQHVKKGDTIALLDGTDYTLQRQEAIAEVARIEALLANQAKIVERNRSLMDKNFISKNALDDATTQQDALKQQLAGAKSHVQTIEHNGAKNRVLAPTDGIVQKQIASDGDYVRVGDPIIQIISKKLLRAHLPFPENMADKIKPGLTVKLSTPTSSKEITTTVRELKPEITDTNRSIDVIAEIQDAQDWQPGASVNGKIILGDRPSAILVPEQSVILRPAGEVVYEIVNGVAHQRIVKTGMNEDGQIEIVQGLKGGETIAVDGAAFLTDKAKVSILKPNRQEATEKSPR